MMGVLTCCGCKKSSQRVNVFDGKIGSESYTIPRGIKDSFIAVGMMNTLMAQAFLRPIHVAGGMGRLDRGNDVGVDVIGAICWGHDLCMLYSEAEVLIFRQVLKTFQKDVMGTISDGMNAQLPIILQTAIS